MSTSPKSGVANEKTLPPRCRFFSRRVTLQPARARVRAARSPEIPPPTTATFIRCCPLWTSAQAALRSRQQGIGLRDDTAGAERHQHQVHVKGLHLIVWGVLG